MIFKCSECGGEIKIVDNQLVCTKCKRTKNINISKQPNNVVKEIDMNDNTKNYNSILFS